jgi:hypothetical protein
MVNTIGNITWLSHYALNHVTSWKIWETNEAEEGWLCLKQMRTKISVNDFLRAVDNVRVLKQGRYSQNILRTL